MKGDWFYSKSTRLYVARNALTVDSRVKGAAERAGIEIDWDDEGRTNNIDFDDAKNLMEALGAKMLTPVEYWQVLNDAIEENDTDMVQQLMSNRYTERFDRVYFFDETGEKGYIDNPKIIEKYKYDGKKQKSKCPLGTPGWFNWEGNINPETGEPIHVEIDREKFATSWKYWSPDLGLNATKLGYSAPIRGYVTSVGKPSFDLGIPPDSRQPNQMVRECRYKPLEPVIDPVILEKAEKLIASHDKKGIHDFVKEHGYLFVGYDSLVYKLREQLFDELGDIALHQDIKDAAKKLSSISNKKLSYNDFFEYMKNTKQTLQDALDKNKDIVFVMGHKNPDTDTVVSSLFEAWRNYLMNGENVTYIPIVQSTRMPDEVTHLLKDTSDHVLFTNDPLYQKAKESGLSRWISVDQNREPEVQKYFITISDHHVVSEAAKNRDLPKTLEMLGSCAALITRKYLGMGLEFSEDLAKLLYGAALMDTENRVEHKMTQKDVEIMDFLKEVAQVEDDNVFYRDLMSYLLNTDDAELLFRRDYKEDWGFGFAVAKVKNGFSEDGEPLKGDLIARMYEMAKQNNTEKNLPLTLLKIADYMGDNETVNRERIYFVFNENTSEKFKKTTKKILESVIRFDFPEDSLESGDDYIEFWGTGKQLSRKKTAPILQPVVTAFNRYFYSPSINHWVKRDFLKYTKEVKAVAENLSTDSEGRINYITFPEAKELSKKLGFEMLSLNEYWRVLKDAKEINDIQMMGSLQGSNFVEFLDSAIVDYQYLIDHPEIKEEKAIGKKRRVVVPEGKPGLIHPDSIDLMTGIPKEVLLPNIYGNPELWRYWEPDSDLVFPCRSYIFLLKQPCWDGKFHIKDSFPNLGLRPVVKEVKDPEVDVSWNEDFLKVDIFVEGEHHLFEWPKKIGDYANL